MLYIGSDNELPLINPEDWKNINIKEDTWIPIVKAISIEVLKDNEISVRDKFKEKNVVYAGSYEGCGCGYSHCLIDDDVIEDNPAEVEASIRSRKALYDYVKENKVTTIYGCWAGDESLPAEEEIEISSKKLTDRKFEFKEKVIMKILINDN